MGFCNKSNLHAAGWMSRYIQRTCVMFVMWILMLSLQWSVAEIPDYADLRNFRGNIQLYLKAIIIAIQKDKSLIPRKSDPQRKVKSAVKGEIAFLAKNIYKINQLHEILSTIKVQNYILGTYPINVHLKSFPHKKCINQLNQSFLTMAFK